MRDAFVVNYDLGMALVSCSGCGKVRAYSVSGLLCLLKDHDREPLGTCFLATWPHSNIKAGQKVVPRPSESCAPDTGVFTAHMHALDHQFLFLGYLNHN